MFISSFFFLAGPGLSDICALRRTGTKTHGAFFLITQRNGESRTGLFCFFYVLLVQPRVFLVLNPAQPFMTRDQPK